MNKMTTLLASLGLGAGLMYFYDPSRGNRRRAMLRDRATSMRNQADDAIDVAVRDLRNRTRGVLADAMAWVSEESPSDWLVEERLRSSLGRYPLHTRAMNLRVEGGRAILTGPVLASEVDRLVKAVASVRGVQAVENQLDVRQEPGDIPALQGDRSTYMSRADGQVDNWPPSLRLLSGVGGGLLAVYGLARRGLIGTALGITGLGLAARGVTNLDLKTLIGSGTARDAIRVRKAIQINRPVDEVYRFWRNFENFPGFMTHLQQVKDLGNGRSHWVAKGPVGTPVEWDAIITREIQDELIAWESVAGSEVRNTGQVRFEAIPDGGTRISVNMSYTPPAGALGHAVAALLGADPKQSMDDDLARLKTLLEEGKPA